MNADELRNLAESYYYGVYDVDYEVIDEGKVGLYTQPETSHKRLMSHSPYAMMSPSQRIDAKAQELGVTHPKTKRERKQSRVAHGVNVDFHSAANAVRKTQADNERRAGLRESYDIYDIVLDYLLSEGICETVHNAENVMVNMSEEWIGAILDEVLRPKNIGYGMHDDDDRERGTTHDPETGHKEYDPFHPQNIKASTPQAKKIKDRLQKMITSQNPGTRARGRALHAHLINPDTPFASHEKAVRNRVRGENK